MERMKLGEIMNFTEVERYLHIIESEYDNSAERNSTVPGRVIVAETGFDADALREFMFGLKNLQGSYQYIIQIGLMLLDEFVAFDQKYSPRELRLLGRFWDLQNDPVKCKLIVEESPGKRRE